ncbi:MAG: UDP-4-amino-4,6-dideoxy-N-acetyl-beta-L-altrosamine transaminase [Candidatus Magasanikbacteria bacterium RIFCSPHIGHO2_01_FULL_33_34]|uniref:UDP-4-amino-4, 6-dideoxy-N-acetyl-beta-L-altrosamine transaminase n=1 Tax=Candidatus Magasanikbacteria bacterium RIFCSPHIGHO2_01_FULL_33_34 TaxID=1798671 RepID=A0A1F6LJA8_9BACT|nr:MAG: UDP-4-amino-4,6-dideoxy-N-acetyl-beta-L-altrosamine transaminase [Candidatus Magasanikbacteria bacterium RIFCSPHIGHO2_01_FULL_33_34]OGH65349.1 MAG: UDP-4-amino-4,6-dideoxy-N-acetyl-beta-L-altrosamine transaminase [Candidatus Magasanikbacteria bacterium RIFCSPHIGHO2_02_FULL_33_17]OGH76125.1 MAG: UDP-4-amino-4,6-dideoxy-N-acetyl-beta-L-altrosamine transaminase [Candidatus Magasanikbacteria bacterium RIFCSPLOWO2_01_FULL_33_34]OGH81074.1 MAG: UDP-4-amino-4,6-dideoxy-N-acetyl-beta-L-altrosami
MIPYGHQSIDKEDIDAVVDALGSDCLTQGERVTRFEKDLADYCGAKYAVVVSNGTAALHSAFVAVGIGSGDEFITTSLTFVATSNVGVWQGARPVFVDIDPTTGNMDISKIEEKITDKTKAIVPIDYTGRPVDLEKIKEIADRYNLKVIEDASQALGASFNGRKVGSISDLSTFSFHPVKNITTGEGGAILTDNEEYYKKMKRFITHGIIKENLDKNLGAWYFDMVELGLNYRLPDFACALGIRQLSKLNLFLQKRKKIVEKYDEAFLDFDNIITPVKDDEIYKSAWHLYTIRLKENLVSKKVAIFDKLRAEGIGVQVHHIPVHMHTFYKNLGYTSDGLEQTEKWYNSVISLPLYPDLTEDEQKKVIEKVKAIVV